VAENLNFCKNVVVGPPECRLGLLTGGGRGPRARPAAATSTGRLTLQPFWWRRIFPVGPVPAGPLRFVQKVKQLVLGRVERVVRVVVVLAVDPEKH
jgi:hypothetical protein